MSFNFKLLITILKRSIIPAILCILASSLVIAVIALSAASTAFVSYLAERQERSFCGETDIRLETGNLSQDRFFGITQIKNDSVIMQNSVLVAGVFNTHVNVLDAKGNKSFSALSVSTILELEEYNPIMFKSEAAETLGRDEIVISELYAKQNGLVIGDTVTITFGSLSADYKVGSIAKDEGIFYEASKIFMEPIGFRKLFPLYSQGVVTHCFVKARDAKDVEILIERLGEMFPEFLVVNVKNGVTARVYIELIDIPFKSIAFLAAAFSVTALLVLVIIFFSPSKDSFRVLHNLGMSLKRIRVIGALTGILIGCVAAFLSVPIIYAIIAILRSAIPLAKGFSIDPLILGRAVLFSFILLVVFFTGFCYRLPNKDKVKKSKENEVKITKCNKHSIKSKHKCKPKGLYLAKLFSLKVDRLWLIFMGFFTLALSVMLSSYLVVHSANVRAENLRTSYPFDLTISNIANPDSSFFDSIKSSDDVSLAVQGSLHKHTILSFEEFSVIATVIGLDELGIEYVLDGSSMPKGFSLQGQDIILGQTLAMRYGMRVGDKISTTINDKQMDLNVVGFLESSYYDGMYAIMSLDCLGTEQRPYSSIFVNTLNIKGTIDSVYERYPVSNLAVINNKLLAEQYYFNVVGFVRILLILSSLVTIVSMGTTIIMLFLWRVKDETFRKKLSDLGQTRASYVKLVAFVTATYLLPVASLAFSLAFCIAKLFLPIGFLFNAYQPIFFSPLLALLSLLILCLVFILFSMLFSYCIEKKPSKIKKSH